MSDVDTRRLHYAARLEDHVNRAAVAVLRRRGWVPTVQVNRGYGAAEGVRGPHATPWVRVFGRVVMGRPTGHNRATASIRGWRSFVTAQVEHAPVRVEVDGVTFDVRSDRSGLVDAVLQVSLSPGHHRVTMTAHDGGTGHGEVVVVGPACRTGLVSDIDDTAMVTALPRPLIAAWNTFVREETVRAEVPGMAQLYRQYLTRNPQAFVVYLSTGAWNTAPFLRRFLRRHGFPVGPLLLTDWGPTNTGWFRSGRAHKLAALRRLRWELPDLRWLLVGDDGQHDPDIYSEIAREAPETVQAIALRELTAAEHVLSHGLPLPEDGGAPVSVPVISGPDGYRIAERLVAVDLL